MKKLLVSFFMLMIATMLTFGQEFVIAVSDFKVESDNPGYKYLGKGISRLVASELRKSGKVRLVVREDMNKLIAEQAMSLSDLMDASKQVRIGKMVSAQYIVMGEIIDMSSNGLLVSVRMAKVETGEIVWQDERQEKLAVYDYMGAYFAKSLLGPLGVNAEQTTIAKIEKKEEKKPEAIIKTSEGIDAYDRKDAQTAKKTLEEAKAIDPANDVAAEYLAKLTVNTAKFKVMLEPYYSDQNPAYLGIMKTDRMYLISNESLQTFLTIARNPPPPVVVLPNGNELLEWDYRGKVGYAFPVSDHFGLSIEGIYFGTVNELAVPVVFTHANSLQTGCGGVLGAGFQISDVVSIGLGLGIYAESNSNVMFFNGYQTALHAAFSFNGGVLFRSPDESLIVDLQAGYDTGRIGLVDPDTVTVSRDVGMPLFLEGTLTLALNQKRTFIIMKLLNDVCFDRIYYYGRIIPAAEHFFLDWLSVRLGAELAYARLNDSDNFGYGAIGGVTFRIVSWGMDIDLNFSYRSRPSRVVERLMYPEGVITFNISWNGVFTSRGK